VRGMTFKMKLLTSQPLSEVAGRHRDRNAWVRHILMPEVPDLDGYLAHSLPSGHTR
jgi:hypothetical protein